eukprot:Lankesteria_metandrocarpae@DN4231_c0_g1_i1.p1
MTCAGGDYFPLDTELDSYRFDKRNIPADSSVCASRVVSPASAPPDVPLTHTLTSIMLTTNELTLFCVAQTLRTLAASFLFGYSISVLNSIEGPLSSGLRLCPTEVIALPTGEELFVPRMEICPNAEFKISLLNSILYVAAIPGSASCQWTLRSADRRYILGAALVLFAWGGVLGAFGTGFYTLLFSRAVSGFGVGIATIATPTIIAEYAHPAWRGTLGMINQIMIGFGIFIGIAIGVPQVGFYSEVVEGTAKSVVAAYQLTHWWRLLLFIPVIVSSLGLIALFTGNPNGTPYWLCLQGRRGDAVIALRSIYGPNAPRSLIQTALSEIGSSVASASHGGNVVSTWSLLKCLWTKGTERTRYWARVLLVGMGVALFQQLSGVNVMASMSTQLFASSQLSPRGATIASLALGACNFLAVFISIPFIELLGRRPLLIIGWTSQFLCLLPAVIVKCFSEAFTTKQVQMVSVISSGAFVAAFATAVGPITWIYLSEIYSGDIRPSALSICGTLNWFAAFVVVFTAKFLPPTAIYITLTVVSAMGLVFTTLCVAETKGCSLEGSAVCVQQTISTDTPSAGCNSKHQLPVDIHPATSLQSTTTGDSSDSSAFFEVDRVPNVIGATQLRLGLSSVV